MVGNFVRSGVTGAWGVTKLVEFMPNNADSISTEFLEKILRGIWLGVIPRLGIAFLYA